MTSSPTQLPDEPVGPAPSPSRESTEARITMLRAELDSTEDRARQAILQYEIGALIELRMGNEALAVREYLASYNTDPTFRPPLFALVRIFERRRSFKNLARLYDAEARSAQTPAERASALVDRGALVEDHFAQPAEARTAYEEALAVDPTCQAAALMLERHLFAAGDRAGAFAAIAQRARAAVDPALKAMLLIETALAKEEEGDVDSALATLREATQLPAARWRVLEHLARVARRNERWMELVEALEGAAQVAEATARGEDPGASGMFSVQRFEDPTQASLEATVLYREAARVSTARLGDGGHRAIENLDRALKLRPDDVLLRQEHMLACELAGELERAAEDARLLLTQVQGPQAAALHFRLAEIAQSNGDATATRLSLAAALEADPRSAVAMAMLEDVLLDEGNHEARIEQLKKRAEHVQGSARAFALWRAAQIATDQLSDFVRAKPLYEGAVEVAEDKAPILRELFGAALRQGDLATASDAASALLGLPIDEDERAALLYDRHELLRYGLGDEKAADMLLRAAVRIEAAATWAPDAARLRAAFTGDDRLLAEAHRVLAERAQDDETAAAHLCGAARALSRAGDEQGAMDVLRRALERRPGHRFAVALLEEILRARGEADNVVALLREAAAAQQGVRAAEMALLVAGAAAEAAGDLNLAAQTYDEAVTRDPTAVAPLWSLRRLADRLGDKRMLLRAREALAKLEADAGHPGRSHLELAEHLDLVLGKPSVAEEPLRAALEDPGVGAAAAASLTLLPQTSTIEVRTAAIERLLSEAEEAGAPSLWRELGGLALATPETFERAEDAATNVQAAMPDDRWALYARLRIAGHKLAVASAKKKGEPATAPSRGGNGAPPRPPLSGPPPVPTAAASLSSLLVPDDDEDEAAEVEVSTSIAPATSVPPADALPASARAEALLALAQTTTDAVAQTDLTLQGLRAKLFSQAGEGSEDAAILAQELSEAAPDSLAAAIALDETLAAGDDPDARARALTARAQHTSPEGRATLEAAQARALLFAGNPGRAVEVLHRVLARDERDLASWDALRVAARDVEEWDDVVKACDRLADRSEAARRVHLLEEAAAVLMDHLERDREAETRLRMALKIDPRSPVAYGRLHDVLAERDDAAGLLQLVTARLEATDEEGELVRLFYEQSRLLRSVGDRRGALTALENLMMLEPKHVGGLALAVEIQVSLEAWRPAVEALRQLAEADVPPAQRRIARLGAADFLGNKLDDARGALEELRKLDEAGLGDATLQVRMSDIAEKGGLHDEAISILARAGQMSSTLEARAAYERRIAAIYEKRRDMRGAITAYKRALDAVPTDLEAGAKLVELVVDPVEGEMITKQFERAVRGELELDATEPEALRKLRQVALWRYVRELDACVLGALVGTGSATPEEKQAYAAHAAPAPPRAPLQEGHIAILTARGDTSEIHQLMHLIAPGVAEADEQTLSALGIARSDRIKPKDPSPGRDEIAHLASLLGVQLGEVYIGGSDPGMISVVPREGELSAWIIGPGVTSPLSPAQRFRVGRLAMAARHGVSPLVRRNAAQGAALIHAAAIAAEAPLPGGAGRADVDELARALSRTLSRKARKAVPDAIRALLSTGLTLEDACAGAIRTTVRAGVVLAGEPGVALAGLLGTYVERFLVQASDDAMDVVKFWLSPSTLALRRELGLAQ